MAESDLKSMLRGVLEELADSDGNLGYMHDWLPALTDFARDCATPDFECVMRGLPPTPPLTFPGVEGIEAAWGDYGSAFEAVRVTMTGMQESKNHVVVSVDQRGRTRHGGVDISQPSAMVFEFAGDHVRRVEFHLDQAEALRVAGLEP